jgi:hypothetical protein
MLGMKIHLHDRDGKCETTSIMLISSRHLISHVTLGYFCEHTELHGQKFLKW